MRVIRMNKRSRYWGAFCGHCSRRIGEGRIALVSTYYVPANGEQVMSPSSQSNVRKQQKARAASKTITLGGNTATGYTVTFTTIHANQTAWGVAPDEIEVQIAYHRVCLDGVIQKAPLEPDEAKERFDEYRVGLLEEYEALPCN